MVKVKAECNACKSTGLYSGMCEGDGVAVICLGCNGTGCMEIAYKPFKKRHERKGIRIVRLSRGTFIGAGVGPYGSCITYKEFLNGVRPSANA